MDLNVYEKLFDDSGESVLSEEKEKRKNIFRAASSLLTHYNEYPTNFEIEFNGRNYYKCMHNFSKDDLIDLGIFNHQDFCKNGLGKNRFRGAKFTENSFVLNPKLSITKNLESKLKRLHEGLCFSEIIVRSLDESGEVVHPEYFEFEFSGTVYREDLDKISKTDGILCLPRWSLFIQDIKYVNYPLVARHYDNTRCSMYSSFRRENPSEDIGEIIMAKSKEFANEKSKKLGINLRDKAQYEKVRLEPRAPNFSRNLNFIF